MLRLTVSLELHGAVVHHESFALPRDGLWLGDDDRARVPFEGLALHFCPDGPGRVAIHGADATLTLHEGGTLVIELDDGGVVRVDAQRPSRLARDHAALGGDARLLLATAAVVLLGAWIETAQRWIDTRDDVAEAVAQLRALPQQLAAPVAPPDEHEVHVEMPPVTFDATAPGD